MTELLIQDKTIVVPGEELAKGMDYIPSFGTYREKEFIISELVGMARVEGKVIKIIPLTGEYAPKKNDTIIGQVEDVTYSGWVINTFSPYHALLNVKDATTEYIPKGADLTEYFNIGDYLVIKIINVTSQKLIDVTAKGPGLRKLGKGRMVRVNPNKVPRIIGKQGSMVSMIKESTNTQIVVGQNGLVWVSGTDAKLENKAEMAIKKIEEEAHTSGLTETMEAWLREK
jgi:exosome complex component RRP4